MRNSFPFRHLALAVALPPSRGSGLPWTDSRLTRPRALQGITARRPVQILKTPGLELALQRADGNPQGFGCPRAMAVALAERFFHGRSLQGRQRRGGRAEPTRFG